MILTLAALAVLLGAVVRGYTGFGASMFWVASLSLLYPPASVVPTVLSLEVLASLVLLPAVLARIEWRSMLWMLAATLVTMPVGVVLLRTLPADPMRLVVAVAIALGTLGLACGLQLGGSRTTSRALVAGSVSGVSNGATGIGGPPAVLLYFSGATDHHVGRATLIAYFLGTDVAAVAMMSTAGLVGRSELMHVLVFAPLAGLGVWAGQWLFARSPARGFRTIVLATLGALSVAMLVRALLGA